MNKTIWGISDISFNVCKSKNEFSIVKFKPYKKMKAINYTFIALLLIGINFSLHSQSKTTKTLEKVNKTVDETIDKVGSLFKKINEETSEDQESKNISNTSEPKKVKVVSNPIVLDADKLFPFYNGAAIIQKGQATALINSKGEVIVPFNQYDFDPIRSKNGFFIPFNKPGFVNSKGVFISTNNVGKVKHGSLGGVNGQYYIETDGSSQSPFHIYDTTGKFYKVTGTSSPNVKFINELIPFGSIGSMGYKNLEDELVINPEYDIAYPFYDGAAIVGKKDQFGNLLYGFIDQSGKAITPIQFSKIPQPFSEGFAIVFYKEQQKYSFIDKQGNVLFTDQGKQFGPFNNGVSYKQDGANPSILNASMTEISVQEFLSQYGISPKNNSGQLTMPSYGSPGVFKESYSSSIIPFSFYDGKEIQRGYIFLKSNIAVIGKFAPDPNDSNMQFDEVSGLKLVAIQNSNMVGDITEGYMNSDGEIVIIKGKPSKW